MNYELAKKLKEAGFPQPEHDLERRYYMEHLKDCPCPTNMGTKPKMCPDENCTCGKDAEIYIPTLSELIEACGPIHTFILKKVNNWIAEGCRDNTPFCSMDGDTPEEAVANLYLKLNTK